MSGLCTAGESTATVKGNTTVKQDDAAGAKNTAAQYVANEQDPSRLLGLNAPDFTDTSIEDARKRMAMQLVKSSSRRDALNSYGGSGALPVGYSLLK